MTVYIWEIPGGWYHQPSIFWSWKRSSSRQHCFPFGLKDVPPVSTSHHQSSLMVSSLFFHQSFGMRIPNWSEDFWDVVKPPSGAHGLSHGVCISSTESEAWARKRRRLYREEMVYVGISIHEGSPIAGWFTMENPSINGWFWEYPHFRKPAYWFTCGRVNR